MLGVSLDPLPHLLEQGTLFFSWRATGRHDTIESGLGEFQATVDEIAQGVGQILVDAVGKELEGEDRVIAFRGVGDEPVPPVVGGELLQCPVHEDTALATGGELSTVVVEPVEALDKVN